VSNKSNDAKSRVHRLVSVSEDYYPLLDALSHPHSAETGKWTPGSLKTLKQWPLFRSSTGEYHILNWNYFYRSVHQAILRDFHAVSGISAKMKGYGDFKNWVAKEVTEKRLFRTLLEMVYENAGVQVRFPDKRSEEKPDAVARQGRHVVMIECKDTDVGDIHQTGFEYDRFMEDIQIKHVRNKNGAPKSVLQLGRNVQELRNGQFPAEYYVEHHGKDLWVLPVLVCDGYLYSAPGVNEMLDKLYRNNINVRSGPLTVMTLEYLFRKIADLKGKGLRDLLQQYQKARGRKQKQFHENSSADRAFEAFASIEEMCPVTKLPYKASSGFISVLFDWLGLPSGLKEEL